MFEKNLSKLKNIRLENELRNIPLTECTKDIAFVKTLNDDIVFLKGEVPVEDVTNPIEAAKKLVTDTMRNLGKNDVIVQVGFGVGYIIDELFNSTKSRIVVYEPDSKYLRFIFETIDLGEYIEHERVFISDDINECIDFILAKYLNDDKIEFVVSDILSIFYKDDFIKFSELLYTKLRCKIIDINTIKELSKSWVENILDFVKLKKQYYSFDELKSKFTAKNALIIGAGPSLEDNLEYIKENQNKFVILAVNRTLDILEKNGIIPDFALYSDAKHVKNKKLSDEFMSKLNIIMNWKADAEIAEINSKNLFMYFSDAELFLDKYAKDIGITQLPSESSTMLMAILSAYYMDFSKIYLCGYDLAFKNSQAYSEGDNINIDNGVAIIDSGKKHIVKVMSVTGEKVQTREDYASFIQTTETLIKTLGINNLYNVTTFGAMITGMNYTIFNNVSIFGQKPDVASIISDLKYFDKDINFYLKQEKILMLEIYDIINNKAPISQIRDKIANTTILYEYLQYDILEFLRTSENENSADILCSNAVLAIDRLTAKIR